MKAYTNAAKTKRMFYNPRIRLWTMLEIDVDGDEVCGIPTQYFSDRRLAFKVFGHAIDKCKQSL